MNFNLLSFKRYPYINNSLPINLGNLNIILGALTRFPANYRESSNWLFSKIIIFGNADFGLVTEVPKTTT